MDLKNIGFEQLLSLVRQLPEEKLVTLKAVLKTKDSSSKNKSRADFKLLLLNGPVMGNKQFETFITNRERFSAWKKK